MKATVYYKSGNPDVYPIFRSGCLFRPASARLPAPLDGANVRFFAFARTALAAGLGLLGLKPGDNVLVPSFICDVVMAPFMELSIEPRFYDLDEKLEPDLDAAILRDRVVAALGDPELALLAVKSYSLEGVLPVCRRLAVRGAADRVTQGVEL